MSRFPFAAAVLSTAEMAEADRWQIAAGTPGWALMSAAGRAVADAVRRRWPPRRTLILCGPGNNGGDGFIAAAALSAAGWPVTVALLGAPARLAGDVAWAAAQWGGEIIPLQDIVLDDRPLIVDALFGAGLSRPVDGPAAEALARAEGLDSVAIDIPSGVDGDTGAIRGKALPAALTVTFFRLKPGHLLLPGRRTCGETIVADIGIAPEALRRAPPKTARNGPDLWRIPRPSLEDHKYRRGHALILGGGAMTGAARLAAGAARRAGAGLTTIAAPAEARAIYAADAPGLLIADSSDWAALVEDPRRNALLLGPGGGADERMRAAAMAALGRGRAVVLDADALTAFAAAPDALFERLDEGVALTPHEGEFARLFAVEGDKLSRARQAARRAGAIIVLKGADTVIAHPDGRAVINANAPPTLATAGSGDVLAGLILGLAAQGMAMFEAASAAVWLQGEAAAAFGPGLIAEDIVAGLPAALRRAGDLPFRPANPVV